VDGGRDVTGRLVLLANSPRLPAGLLSAAGWAGLRSGAVYAGGECDQVAAVRAAGIPVTVCAPPDGRGLYERAAGSADPVVWLAGPDGDPALVRTVGDLAARDGRVTVEVVYGSWDPPGARLLDVVAVMDRLRSPGGCPWDAEQTHASLMPYLLEEAYEAYQALEDGDADALREELGDLLLQVAFHARLAEEADPGWNIDEVAGDLVAKLVRRHPHVFADRRVSGADEVVANWDEIKAAEKQRDSVTDGVPLALPALVLAETLYRKARRLGVPADAFPAGPGLGERLFAEVTAAADAGTDAEAALRSVARAFRDRLAAAERAVRAAGDDPAGLPPEAWHRLLPG